MNFYIYSRGGRLTSLLIPKDGLLRFFTGSIDIPTVALGVCLMYFRRGGAL